MDRYPLFRKTLILTALVGVAACGGKDSQDKNAEQVEFPASQSRVENSNHTAQLEPAMPSKAEPMAPVTIPGIASEVDKAVEVEPVNYSGFMQRARSRFATNDYSGALSDYQVAVEKRPNSFRPRVQLARTFLALGKVESAREHAELAIDIDGASSLAWNTLGRVELAESDNEAAIVSFERSVEENEDNSYAWNNLGFVHMEEGNYEEAVEALEAATSGASPTSYMWNNLGMAYEHLDRITLARASYRQAAEQGSGRAQDNFDRLEGVVSLVVEPMGQPEDEVLSDSDTASEVEADLEVEESDF